ncbi:MAG: REP-associated tyrosine transposase [Armatimonadota bacterium]
MRRLDQVHVYWPTYFITMCAIDRQRVLVPLLGDLIHTALADASRMNQWCVGRFVLMPDHLHLFASPLSNEKTLAQFLGGFKQLATRLSWGAGWQGKLWQRECFDHLLRSEDSYAEKWEYVRNNPVRAGLVSSSDDWPYQGELEQLSVR